MRKGVGKYAGRVPHTEKKPKNQTSNQSNMGDLLFNIEILNIFNTIFFLRFQVRLLVDRNKEIYKLC